MAFVYKVYIEQLCCNRLYSLILLYRHMKSTPLTSGRLYIPAAHVFKIIIQCLSLVAQKLNLNWERVLPLVVSRQGSYGTISVRYSL